MKFTIALRSSVEDCFILPKMKQAAEILIHRLLSG